MRKYRNIPVEVDGIRFDSRKEARRWSELKLLERAGEVTHLERQVRFACRVDGHLICHWVADFVFFDTRREGPDGQVGCRVVEDVKSPITRKNPVYRIKKKLVEALFNVVITET